MQTRLESLIESIINIAIGYFVALVSQLMIFPLFDVHLTLTDNLLIGAWFTGVSLIRSYVIRRWFNARLHTAAMVLAGSQSREMQLRGCEDKTFIDVMTKD